MWKYLLGDTDFALNNSCMTPHKGIIYHLKNWCNAGTMWVLFIVFILECIKFVCTQFLSETKEEIYNMQHASVQNVIV